MILRSPFTFRSCVNVTFYPPTMFGLLHLYFILFLGRVLKLFVSFSYPDPYQRAATLSTRFFMYVRDVANTFVPTRGVPRLVRTTALDHVQNLCYVLEQIPANEANVRAVLTKILRLWKPNIVIRTPEEASPNIEDPLPWE